VYDIRAFGLFLEVEKAERDGKEDLRDSQLIAIKLLCVYDHAKLRCVADVCPLFTDTLATVHIATTEFISTIS